MRLFGHYDSYIFDLDGTLWDSLDGICRAWTAGLMDFGMEHTITRPGMEAVVGRPFLECLEALVPGRAAYNREIIERIDYYTKEYLQSEGGLIYPSAGKVLREISQQSKAAIISNCQDWYLQAFYQYSGMERYIFADDCHGRQGFNKALMLKNMISEHSLTNPVYIGDTEGDYHSAREAGIDFIYASYGFGKVQEPVKKIDALDELLID